MYSIKDGSQSCKANEFIVDTKQLGKKIVTLKKNKKDFFHSRQYMEECLTYKNINPNKVLHILNKIGFTHEVKTKNYKNSKLYKAARKNIEKRRSNDLNENIVNKYFVQQSGDISENLHLQFLTSNDSGDISNFMNKLKSYPGMEKGYKIFAAFENWLIFANGLKNSSNLFDVYLCFLNIYKLSTDGHKCSMDMFTTLFNQLCRLLRSDFKMQAKLDRDKLEGFTFDFTSIRKVFTDYEEAKEMPVFKKFYGVLMFVLSFSVFKNINEECPIWCLHEIRDEALKKKKYNHFDFFMMSMDSLTFILEKGWKCLKTGSINCLYATMTHYDEWYDKVLVLQNQSLYLTNPEIFKLDVFEFLHELDGAIEQGKIYLQHLSRTKSFEHRYMMKMWSSLVGIKNDFLSKKAAMKPRRAPCSFLLYGGSGVGKSTFTNMLYQHYGKLFSLPTEPEYMYTRNPIDEYWVGFNSYMWCVVLDDIAFQHPNMATAGGDPSLMEMLQVINNVPFVPIQAALEDKGKTPLNSKLVIATTNTEHLNAHAYFACPLAVQRRFPYIIDIKPKDKHIKHCTMLDTANLPPTISYPDYWNITIKKVIPISEEREHARARIEKVCEFNNITDFLLWFNNVCLEFERVQDSANDCLETMKQAILCCCHNIPIDLCKKKSVMGEIKLMNYEDKNVFSYQSGQIYFHDWKLYTFIKYIEGIFLNFLNFLNPFYYIFIIYTFICIQLNLFLFLIYYYMVKRKLKTLYIQPNNIRMVLAILGGISASFYLFGKLGRKSTVKQSHVEALIQDDDSKKICEILKVGQKPPIEEDCKENPWKTIEASVCSFEISKEIHSSHSMTELQFENYLKKACIHISCNFKEGSKPVKQFTSAYCIYEDIYLVNSHAIPDCTFEMTVISDTYDPPSKNINCTMHKDEIYRIPNTDIAAMRIRFLPCRKNISMYFPEKELRGGYDVKYVNRLSDGSLKYNTLRNCKLYPDPDGYKQFVYLGRPNNITVEGDCGSIAYTFLNGKKILLGMHFYGSIDGAISGCIAVTLEHIKAIKKNFPSEISSGTLITQYQSKSFTISKKCHKKAAINYAKLGCVEYCGTIDGFRTRANTHVKEKYLSHYLKRFLGWELKFGAPKSTWGCFYNAFEDSINQYLHINVKEFDEIRDVCISYYISHLDKKNLDTLMVYDIDTVVNGVPGVKYIDSMNRKTSAGFPYNKSKKYFEVPIDGTDRITYNDEILNEVSRIWNCYKRGELVHPVFSGTRKDEPMKFNKIENELDRIFCGAPLAWCIVVRMLFLSVIKLIQSNRFIFGDGPGLNCMSLEWEEVLSYLNGDLVEDHDDGRLNRMICGDYKKFDKRINAAITRTSFEILIGIMATRYSEEHIRMCRCVMFDCIFPLVNYNGDLYRFYGTLPSGIPLTVIINGRNNHAYLMYAFMKLKPKDVHLTAYFSWIQAIVYGDDNIMSVSKKAPWFNHTSIATELKKIGVVYTMAEKDRESVPYISIEECDFLKRKWRLDEDLNSYVCPIDEESIKKMLMIGVETNAYSEKKQATTDIGTAMSEYFFFGRGVFEEKKKIFKNLINELKLEDYCDEYTLPDYSVLVHRFFKNSEGNPYVEMRKRRPVNVGRFPDWNKPKGSIDNSDCDKDNSLFSIKRGLSILSGNFRRENTLHCMDKQCGVEILSSKKINNNCYVCGSNKNSGFLCKNCKYELIDKNSWNLVKQCKTIYEILNYREERKDPTHDYLRMVQDMVYKPIRDARVCVTCQDLFFPTWFLPFHSEVCKRCIFQKYMLSNKTMLEKERFSECFTFSRKFSDFLAFYPEYTPKSSVIFKTDIAEALCDFDEPEEEDDVVQDIDSDSDSDYDTDLDSDSDIDLDGVHFLHQSGESEDNVAAQMLTQTNHSESENVQFLDENQGDELNYDSVYDNVTIGDDNYGLELKDFLKRPVLINTFSWADSTLVGNLMQQILPWKLYLSDSIIKNKLSNFAYIRGKLKLKILINASPFFYGAAIASYRPLHNFNKETIYNDANTRFLIPYSQRPHVFIYPQSNQGAEMSLPFIYPYNYLSTLTNTAAGDMGQLTFIPYAQLRSANGATGSVTITTYAWMEDVELSGPTIGLVMQSGRRASTSSGISEPVPKPQRRKSTGWIKKNKIAICDEDAPTESISTIIKESAKKIGTMALSSGIDSLGFSNAPVVAPPKALKQSPFPSLASSEISYPVEKLTLDPHNELTIDPQSIGIQPYDELDVQSLCSKESYLTSFSFATTNAVSDNLFQFPVSPYVFDNFSGTNQNVFYMAPMGWVGMLFNSWRGDIIVRLKVIATPFHKGRLRVSYDPLGDATTNIGNTTTTSQAVATQVIDIGKDDSVEFTIPYQQQAAWCNSNLAKPVTFTSSSTTVKSTPFTINTNSPTFNTLPNVHNGTFNVKVLNALTSPITTSTITVLVFVRGGKNLEFANPGIDSLSGGALASNNGNRMSYFTVQSKTVVSEATTLSLYDTKDEKDPDRYKVYYGERIHNLRQLLRRYCFHSFINVPSTSVSGSTHIQNYVMSRIPSTPGYDLNGIAGTGSTNSSFVYYQTALNAALAANKNFNWVNFTYQTWLAPGYIGQRGSVNWSVQNIDDQIIQRLAAYRINDISMTEACPYKTTTSNAPALSIGNYCKKVITYSSAGTSGSSVVNTRNQAVLNINVPNMMNTKFTPTDASLGTAPYLNSSPNTNQSYDVWNIETWRDDTVSDRQGSAIQLYTGVGMDYSLFFFLNVPSIFYYSAVPTAV